MAATTISRFSWTNDTGSVSSPAGDGTLINNAQLQLIFDAIDNLFSAAFTFGSTLRVEGLGSHLFTAGGGGANALQVRNTSAGTANLAELDLGNDASATVLSLYATSTTYTAGGAVPQDGALVRSSRGGGLNFEVTHASGIFRWFGTASVAMGSFAPPASTLGNVLTIFGGGFGAGNKSGSGLIVGSNSSGGGAAGWISLITKGAAAFYLWVDNAGNLEIGTAPPEEDGTPSDTSGTIVGTQSSLSVKNLIYDAPPLTPEGALAVIVGTPVHRFSYKSGACKDDVFYGIVTDFSPQFGKHHGRNFNDVNAFGYSVQAFKALHARTLELERRLELLEQRAA